ncbi:hypothetical protein [Pseudorhodoplanes sinuspersici]|uniref:Uncharacterized protein n=1 Tax=Pseudorhodoplanes sinuspersici TaxID=1235591 RepID=A0A1W6ZTB3_9HYPH|nr:hypothetical protein [Pseudorhodoplanes sinuspersici]ARQ00536.1 hypothetical protein CAK95_16725 [Pseudorhodoplanes sinuspersici]RKE67273.1 hypothetical protein DFP91_5034 [Pseudorhodoplanes sinuspersici]
MLSERGSLPNSFKKIRLELAREKGYPAGSSKHGYIIVAPLDEDHRLDPETWKSHRDACRIVHFRPTDDDEVGHLVHRPGGTWALRYDIRGDDDDETGYHFQDERFEIGEYVSIRDSDETHTYRVVSVERV